MYQIQENEKRAEELVIANQELAFQNQEKENRASELVIANEELAYQNQEKANLIKLFPIHFLNQNSFIRFVLKWIVGTTGEYLPSEKPFFQMNYNM